MEIAAQDVDAAVSGNAKSKPASRSRFPSAITFSPNAEIDEALFEYMEEQLKLLWVLPPEAPQPKRRMDYAEWLATKEGRFHAALMARYVLPADHINAKTATSIQRRLQAQNVDMRGRPPKFDPRKRHWSSQRKVRLYIINKLLAKGLGIDTSDWPAPLPPIEPIKTTPLEPIDTYHSLERFEEWTDLKLPRAAWALYTKEERLALSAKHPDLPRLHDGGITVEAYADLRSRGEA